MSKHAVVQLAKAFPIGLGRPLEQAAESSEIGEDQLSDTHVNLWGLGSNWFVIDLRFTGVSLYFLFRERARLLT